MASFSTLTKTLEEILGSLERGESSLPAFQSWIDTCRSAAPKNNLASTMFLAIAEILHDEAKYRIESKDWDPDGFDGPGPFP